MQKRTTGGKTTGTAGESDRRPAGPLVGLVTTRSLLALRAALEEWEAASFGDPVAAYHRRTLGRYLTGLRALAATRDDRVEAVLLAAFALGPRTGGLPGAGDLQALLEAAVETRADVVDLGIAWGCGWHRVVVPDHDWHGRWLAALLTLTSLVAGSANRTLRWLESNVSGVREAVLDLGPAEREELLVSHANHLALELSLGACACGHGVPGAVPDSSCGRADHRLATWEPEVCRLPAFVATAVRGTAQLPPRSGALAVSMLANLLRDDQLVRVETAEFQVCHECNPDLIARAVLSGGIGLSTVSKGLHDLSRCPDCATPTHRGRTYHVARKNWLVVPADWGGQYQPTRRHRCGGCGNLFGAGGDRCPLCGRPVSPGRRLTSVWRRVAGRHVTESGA
jgi:hypothetical protein